MPREGLIDYVTWRRNAARRKILSILPRAVVDKMSRIECCRLKSYKAIADACVDNWDDAMAREAIDALLHRARNRETDDGTT
jgi:hypothetical protein